jgi:hypothetical protein
MIEVSPVQVRRRQAAALQPYADQHRAGQVGVPGTLIPLMRAPGIAMLRISTRGSEMTGSSSTAEGGPGLPWPPGYRRRELSSKAGVAVGCSGPPGAPTGQGAWARADLART